jgi:glutamate/aspartate transport system permease protein
MVGGFDFEIVKASIPFLWDGMQLTLLLTVLAIGGGILGGTILALCRLAPFRALSVFGASYVNFFRSMPLILIIFWFYFLVPFLVGRPVGGFYSVLIAFMMFEAAYYCEIIRAGIQSVGKGQASAGQALGLTYRQNMRYIVLPQAFRNMIPILLTQAIVLFQDTSLVYVVGLRDFLVAADIVANRDNRLMEMYSTCAAVYFVLCLAGSLSIRNLQRKYAL